METAFLEVPATTFLVSKHMLRQPEIAEMANRTTMAVHDKAQELGLKLVGPPVFFYFDFDPHSAEPQHLEIGWPVGGDISNLGDLPENYHIREAGPFSCVAGDYVGSISGIGEGWSRVFRALAELGHKPGSEVREVYKHWVGFDSAENVTELQAQVCLPPVAG